MKKVVVSILNFKVPQLTVKCVSSVLDSSYSNLSIIVVDNDKENALQPMLSDFGHITYIHTGKNLGFTGGNNIGIKKALEMEADFVFLLNPDTEIEKDTIKLLVEGMEKYKADLANPKIYFSESKKIWFAGKIFDFDNVLASHRGVDEIDKGQYDTDEQIQDGTGAALMVSKGVFEKIGLLDDRYFLYYEESDFIYRAKQAGFKIWYLPKAVVYHENAKSTGLGSPLQDYFITRNRMLFASKFLGKRTRFALLREALRNLSNPTRRLALIDFLLGKFGKGSFLRSENS